MRNTFFLVMAFLALGQVYALDFQVNGEFKTGIFFLHRDIMGVTRENARIHNNDGDSGRSEGRLRFGMDLLSETFGMKVRLFVDENKAADNMIKTDYAYGFANLLNNQITISAGLLGNSPWGSGGPELSRELETGGGNPILGIRTELKPGFIPGLNLGFVLNRDNDTPPIGIVIEQFGDIIFDSVVGIAYENKYFNFRFAYRFDRKIDSPAANTSGEQFVYRVEEHVLGLLLPGMSISANGFCIGIGKVISDSGQGGVEAYMQNWLYMDYDHDLFRTGVDVGYRDTLVFNGQFIEVRPYFYLKLFNLMSVGVKGGMEFGFNTGDYFPDGTAYNFWFVEPQVQLNLINNFNVSLVYRYTAGVYGSEISYVEDQQTHWFNLRFVFTF